MITDDWSRMSKVIMCHVQGCSWTVHRNADYCVWHIGLGVDCERCGAQRGNRCVSVNGKPSQFHVIRVQQGRVT